MKRGRNISSSILPLVPFTEYFATRIENRVYDKTHRNYLIFNRSFIPLPAQIPYPSILSKFLSIDIYIYPLKRPTIHPLLNQYQTSPFLLFFFTPHHPPSHPSSSSLSVRSLSPAVRQRSPRYDAVEKYCLLVELSIRV